MLGAVVTAAYGAVEGIVKTVRADWREFQAARHAIIEERKERFDPPEARITIFDSDGRQ